MDNNAVAEAILPLLTAKYDKTYRNQLKDGESLPYVIFTLENAVPTYPSYDIELDIDIYEDGQKIAQTIEDIADNINGDGDIFNPTGLDKKIINTDTLSLDINLETRQYIPPTELVGMHFINMKYILRVYFK